MSAALFEVARFQVIAAALTPGPAERLEDAYVYAWNVGLFPLFDDWARLHASFEEHFSIGKEMMRELMKFLDQSWSDGRVPSFYELETHYDVRGGGPWARAGLIHAVRYAFLSGRFDSAFYETIKRRGDHPVEANGIADPFDRSSELYLG